jgi:glycosyltransferase involved in cell wall biosynthesis
MRIAMISEHASPLAALGGVDAGGQNTHVAALARAVADRGHDVRVYTRRDSTDLPAQVRLHGRLRVVHTPAGPARPVGKDDLLPYMEEFGRWLGDTWCLDGWAPDVVHAHFWMSGVAALSARRALALPIVQTFHALGTVKRRHQGSGDTSPPDRIGWERRLGRTAERVIAQCADEVSELRALGVPAGPITVVPSGVDTRLFTPDGPAVRRSGRTRILSVGRLVDRKGHADAIRALAGVPDAELVIVGGPPAGQLHADPVARALRAAAETAGVAGRVHLAGGVDLAAMPGWYRSADMVVSAAWYEPFGLTPLEAMACGVPVVGYGVGGLLDTVLPGVTGELVPARDVTTLATTLAGLCREPRRCRAYGRAGRERAASYDWPNTARRVIGVYGAAVNAYRTGDRRTHSGKAVTVS